LIHAISISESGCKGTKKVEYKKEFPAFRINQELTISSIGS